MGMTMKQILLALFFLVAATLAWGQGFDPNKRSPNIGLTGGDTTGTDRPTDNCGLILGSPVVFCDTFDVVNPGIASRTGALDPEVWGVSRTTGWVNSGVGFYNGWTLNTTLVSCTGDITVTPPNDIIICNGQVREAVDDNPSAVFDAGTVVILAMYPKQPFDFAGRTGTVSFDVSDDSGGSHSAWPEFWMSTLPVPAPFAHFGSWHAYPQFGFGIRFDGFIDSTGTPATCPQGDTYTGVGGAILVNNYVGIDTDFDDGLGIMFVQGHDCVAKSSGPGDMNHFEIRVSLNQIDVYGTDAGVTPTAANIRHLATIQTNQGGFTDLGFTRGLVWIDDVHYNGDKAVPSQRTHTFSWDNVAFDGPFTFRDFTFDSLDALVPDPTDMTIDLGKYSVANATSSWNVLNVPGNASLAAAARVLFNFNNVMSSVPTVLNVIVNGHSHSAAWPYPDSITFSWRTFAVTIPISDLVPGTNVVQIGSDREQITSNVDIVLANVAGGIPVLPGANNSYPGGLCQFFSVTATTAFCESVLYASPGGRAGDLDDSRWSVSRTLTDGLETTNLIAFPPVPTSACQAGVTGTLADNDIMVCDAASGHSGQFLVAMIAQNYAMISMRPRQMFDFTGRTGTITFNVDAITQGEGSWWPAVYVTDEPISAAINAESVQGFLPTNGIGVNFNDNCAVTDASLTSVQNIYTFANAVETITPTTSPVCFSTLRGSLNHIEIRLSTTSVEVWASDYSTDGGVTFPNFRKVASATLPSALPFSTGYVHFNEKERAPIKNEPGFYTPGYANNYWSNLGFDGPTLVPHEVSYQVPDSGLIDPNSSTDTDFVGLPGAVNIGYAILNTPDSMYACCDGMGSPVTVATFSIPGVVKAGIKSAKLTFTVTYTYIFSFDPTTVALKYSINGGSLLDPSVQPNYAAQHLCTGCPGNPNGGGGVPYSFPIDVSSLVDGTNTLRFTVANSNNGFPPVVANIDLLTFH